LFAAIFVGRQRTSHRSAKLGTQGFREGRNAADRANFNRPIGSQEQRRLA
jgi:hypothetical protein